MRYGPLVLAALVSLIGPPRAGAQEPVRIARIDKANIGFRPYNENVAFGRYKVGLWAPVFVEITAGPEGLPASVQAYLEVETPDFEDVGTIYRTPVRIEPNETRTVVAYAKTGNGNGDVKVTLHVGNRKFFPPPDRDMAVDLGAHVYLALGRRVADLPEALTAKDKDKPEQVQFQEERRRAVVFEDKVDRLPAHWFGYDGVDLAILSADNRAFLTQLADAGHTEQLRALVQWVRRGGRLVVPMSKQTQESVAHLLNQPVWQPPIPVVPPATSDKLVQPERLAAVESWGEVHNMPLPSPGEKPPVIAQLEPAGVHPGAWDIEARVGADGPPLIARVKYGLGQIVYLAFSLDDPAFAQWPGKHTFLRKAAGKLAPRSGQDGNANGNPNVFRHNDSSDVASQLYNALDNFDVRVIPFGVVALFIVLYVIVVGPLEYVLLKYVFGRLEWTWITFPTVVLGVSIIAYFGAYALKGQDLKVNKVDVVDFDLRTDVDAKGQPRSVRVYGQSFLTILSPRIQSYTVGVEPNPLFWGDAKPARPLSADVVSWMARADDGPGGMGRGGGQGFFRKPYFYGTGDPREETLPMGVSGVPIPVWMAKAFSASWEAVAARPPLVADLSYHRSAVAGKDVKITGTLHSRLPVDLTDVWLIYANRCYRVAGGLPAGQGDVKISLEDRDGRLPREWISEPGGEERPNTSQGLYDPSGIVKQLMFQEQLDQTRTLANHSLRRLDLSWRLYEEPPRGFADRRTRDAILVARVRFQSGPAEALTADAAQPLATNLWLGALPESGAARPALDGNLNQDTFVRVLLAVKPAGN